MLLEKSEETKMPISKQFVEKPFFKEVHKETGKEKYEKESKEKHEKDFKEKEAFKEIHKEIAKVEFVEYPQVQHAPEAVVTEQATDALTKNPEKYLFHEKPVAEKFYHKIEFDKHYVIDKQPTWEYTAGPVAVAPGVPVEQRLAALEAAMAQLMHFIPQELRPDLSKGALKQEPAEKPEEEKK